MIYTCVYGERHLYGWVDVIYYFSLPLERTTQYYTSGRITDKKETGIHNNNGMSIDMGTGDEIGININGGATHHRMKAAQYSSSKHSGRSYYIGGGASITFTTNFLNKQGAYTYAHLSFLVAVNVQRRFIYIGTSSLDSLHSRDDEKNKKIWKLSEEIELVEPFGGESL